MYESCVGHEKRERTYYYETKLHNRDDSKCSVCTAKE